MAERNAQDPDSYFEVMSAFELIRVLLEPAIEFLCHEAQEHLKASEAAESRKKRKGKGEPGIPVERMRVYFRLVSSQKRTYQK
jgi:hypothetical protein